MQTLTTTVYTAGIAPEVTLVFKAVVIIAVCLLQSPKTRALLRRRRRAGDGPGHRPAVPAPEPASATPRRQPVRTGRRRDLHDPEQGDPAVTPTPPAHAAPAPPSPRHAGLRRAGVRRRYRASPRPGCCRSWRRSCSSSSCSASGSVRYDGFFSLQVLLNLFIDNAFLIVLAVGMTFVIITGGIDLSRRARSWRCPACSRRSCWRAGWSAVPVMVLVLLIGAGLGLAMGLVIHHLELQPFIVTLAGMFLARGLCYVISVESIPIRDPLFTAVAQGTVPLPGGTSSARRSSSRCWSSLVGAYLLHATRFGRTVYAIGGNETRPMLMGLRGRRARRSPSTRSAGCARPSAALLFAFYSLSGYSLHAVGTELDAIAAVVIGGTLLSGGVGLVVGSLLGVLVLGLIQTFISFEGTLSSWWTRIVDRRPAAGLRRAAAVLRPPRLRSATPREDQRLYSSRARP